MTSGEATERSAEPSPISGLWRRLFAFILDALVLGVVGAALGDFLYDSLAAIGGWGRILGFMIALTYFGVMNSRICGGQTLGKMAMKIRVASGDGATLTLPVSAWRCAIFCVPYFLNGAPIDPALLHPWLIAGIVSMLIFGVGGSIVYLFFFNRKTRQSLHDLIVGSYVVRAAPNAVPHEPGLLWRGHFAIVVALVVVAASPTLFAHRLARTEPFVSLWPLQTALAKERGIRSASVQIGGRKPGSTKKGVLPDTFLWARIVLDRNDIDQERLANRVAEIALDTYAETGKKEAVMVALVYGYDIGIASGWRSRNFSFSPAQWRERIVTREVS